ncbi:MAG: cytochrome c oxidase subunit 3 [Bacteroidia bacterium]|nr:cytochrome c oxidase subunit 3 [Bacteroidia bacterium]
MSAALNMTDRSNSTKLNPRVFVVVLLIVASVMLFAGLTSAFVVRHAEGNWLNFELPQQFINSTVTVLASSITMVWAYYSAKRDNILNTQLALGLTLVGGLAFVYYQYQGFIDLGERGIYFSPPNGSEGGLVSGSFVIALVALHLLHLLGGLIFVTVVFIKSLLLKVHKTNMLSIRMCNTYWHFVGILWIYLYMFLYFAPQF